MGLKTVATPIVLGVVCYVVISSLAAVHVSESVMYSAWLSCIGLAAFFSGYLRPQSSWRNGVIVAVMQPASAVVHFWFTGELANPSSSTGGMVAIAIGTFFVVVLSPIPIGASCLGAIAWRRGQHIGKGAHS